MVGFQSHNLPCKRIFSSERLANVLKTFLEDCTRFVTKFEYVGLGAGARERTGGNR